jgi:proline racemase
MRWSRTLNVVDCHCEGESGKVVVGGVGAVPGESMFDKRVHLEGKMDQIRKILLFEPRGAVWHNANIILPSNNPAADMGFVILESTEYPAMSGSNTICVATVLLETGMVAMKEPVTLLTLESPAGLIKVECECRDGKVRRARLINQPAFVYHLQKPVEVEGLGTLTVDIAYGGMTYTMVDAPALGLDLVPSEARQLCELGQRIKIAAAAQLEVSHPLNPLIPGITQTEFMGPLERRDGHLFARNVVVVSPGRCDRSPCGTGTSARLALMHAKGEIKPGESFIHESIIGSRFDNRIEELSQVGPYQAVIPSIAGQAWISGLYQIGLDPTDPFPNGYTLSDTWMTAIE